MNRPENLTIRLSRDERAALDAQAQREGRSVASLVRYHLRPVTDSNAAYRPVVTAAAST